MNIKCGDNLAMMREMDTESVDLIATDPPYNTGRNFGAYNDQWEYTIDREREYWELGEDARFVVDAAYRAHGESMGAFLCFLAVRVLAMHRILKPTGSLYLHCDTTANSYIRLMLDAIFGARNFRNEITWCYEKPRSASKVWKRNTDTLFFYTKSDEWIFIPQRVPNASGKMEMRKPFKRPDGSIWTPKEPGKQASDYWVDIPGFATRVTAKERTGYPTQKPVALYERIIKASCPEDGVVFDPFMGSGTTLVAARNLGRRYVGIDSNPEAIDLVRSRLGSDTITD